jgi:hypothetical protein
MQWVKCGHDAGFSSGVQNRGNTSMESLTPPTKRRSQFAIIHGLLSFFQDPATYYLLDLLELPTNKLLLLLLR